MRSKDSCHLGQITLYLKVVLYLLGLSKAVFAKDELYELAKAQYYMGLAKKCFDIFLNRPGFNTEKIVRT
jgi:hypothetical protein|tara:strand:+ start:69 stop:278 length:210 start_codon:yes stop_codon:yes gene_type:complete